MTEYEKFAADLMAHGTAFTKDGKHVPACEVYLPVPVEKATRPGCATLTMGRESVTLDPLLPREEFDRRAARWEELAKKFPKRRGT